LPTRRNARIFEKTPVQGKIVQVWQQTQDEKSSQRKIPEFKGFRRESVKSVEA
jgi:hypothetical protein